MGGVNYIFRLCYYSLQCESSVFSWKTWASDASCCFLLVSIYVHICKCARMLFWFNSAPHSLLLTLPRWNGENWNDKSVRTCRLKEDSFLGKAKAAHASKQSKELIHYFPSDVQTLAGKSGVARRSFLERQASSLWTSSLPPSSPQLYCWLHMIWNVFESVSAVLAVSPHSSLCNPNFLLGRVPQEVEKSLTLCKHYSVTTETSVCYQYYFHQKSRSWCPKLHCSLDYYIIIVNLKLCKIIISGLIPIQTSHSEVIFPHLKSLMENTLEIASNKVFIFMLFLIFWPPYCWNTICIILTFTMSFVHSQQN